MEAQWMEAKARSANGQRHGWMPDSGGDRGSGKNDCKTGNKTKP